jgi:hypothetical protein
MPILTRFCVPICNNHADHPGVEFTDVKIFVSAYNPIFRICL